MGGNRNVTSTDIQGKTPPYPLNFKGNVYDVGVVLGIRSARPDDKDNFKKSQDNITRYVMKKINNPQNITPTTKDIKYP